MNSRFLSASQVMMKRSKHFQVTLLVIVGLGIWLLLTGSAVFAQQAPGQLKITGSDASSAPTILLHVYAVDGQGNPTTLDPSALTILHGGSPVSEVSLGSPYEAGTFTIFVLDIPQGVADQIPTIQTAIQQYASEQTMVEQVDSVAIFAVDQLAATQILGASGFRNEIINTFASPLSPTTGATALIDSLMGLLNNIDSLKPREEMIPQIVVFSDGTDVVSTQHEAAEVPKLAAELGVPIYTVVLSNDKLDDEESQTGLNYMQQIATGTLAQSFRLSTAEELQPIWDRIASFREQNTVQYSIAEAVGGDQSVQLSLTSNPNIGDTTTVTIPPGAPRISIEELPEESRNLTLPSLDQAVTLSFSTDVSWMDGVEREVATAQILVNGLVLQDIDVNNLERFDVNLSNLVYGPNRIQVAIIDDQGSRATSPEVVINIAQGETSIPDAVAPSSFTERIWQRVSGVVTIVGGCLGVLIFIILLLVILVAARRSAFLNRIGLIPMLSRVPFLRGYMADVYRVQRGANYAGDLKYSASRYSGDIRSAGQRDKRKPQLPAFLEIIQATTQMPGRIDLDAVEQKIGRSTSRADISLKNDGTVSRVHATIVQEGAGYRIYDENSTSGTFVNEQGVLENGLQLVDGDEIRLGAVRLRFRQP